MCELYHVIIKYVYKKTQIICESGVVHQKTTQSLRVKRGNSEKLSVKGLILASALLANSSM